MIYFGTEYLPLSGLGATPSPDVKQMQLALTQLSRVAADPSLDPGPADGLVGDKTRSALAGALRFIAPRLPSKELQVAITGLSVALPMTGSADTLIRNNAAMVTSALFVAINTISQQQPAPPPTPWWQTGMGRAGLLSLAGVLVLVLLMHRQRALPAGTP